MVIYIQLVNNLREPSKNDLCVMHSFLEGLSAEQMGYLFTGGSLRWRCETYAGCGW